MFLNTYFTVLENACIIDCQSPENPSCNLFKGDMKKNVEPISISLKAITRNGFLTRQEMFVSLYNNHKYDYFNHRPL